MLMGKSGEITIGEVVFLVLNILVFTVLLVFVARAGSGALVYEKAYAKEIAFLIDTAEPYTDITVDLTKGINIAKKNKLSEDNLKKIVQIDNVNNSVAIKLSSGGSHTFRYFSDYQLVPFLRGTDYIIRVRPKKGVEDE